MTHTKTKLHTIASLCSASLAVLALTTAGCALELPEIPDIEVTGQGGTENPDNNGNGNGNGEGPDGTPSGDELCSDTCYFANDGQCDDGGPDAMYFDCEFGTDCADCGARSSGGHDGAPGDEHGDGYDYGDEHGDGYDYGDEYGDGYDYGDEYGDGYEDGHGGAPGDGHDFAG